MGEWHDTLCFAPTSIGYSEDEWACYFKEDYRDQWEDNPGWNISYTLEDDTSYVLIFMPSPEEEFHFMVYYSMENGSKREFYKSLISLSCHPSLIEGRDRDYDVDGNEVFFVYKECFMDILDYWPMLKQFFDNPRQVPTAINWITV